MDIRVENEINMLKKLGLSDQHATMIAAAKHEYPDVANSIIAVEKRNNQIIMEETLQHMVPFAMQVESKEGEFILISE